MFTYIPLEKCNVKILNGGKASAKYIELLIMKKSETNIIVPLWPTYYVPKNPQHTISKTAIKHYNQFITVRKKSL